jgi:hypothetical protein
VSLPAVTGIDRFPGRQLEWLAEVTEHEPNPRSAVQIGEPLHRRDARVACRPLSPMRLCHPLSWWESGIVYQVS